MLKHKPLLLAMLMLLASCGHHGENHVIETPKTFNISVYDYAAQTHYDCPVHYQAKQDSYTIYYVYLQQYNYYLPIFQYNNGQQFTPYDWQQTYQWPVDHKQIRWVDDEGQEAITTPPDYLPRKFLRH